MTFGYDPAQPGAPRRRPAHRSRARRSSLRRPDRRGQVDDRQARHPLLRPDRGPRRSSTATTCATSPSTRCAASSASCPRSRSCSPARIRDNIAFARPDATDDEVAGGGATRVGLERPRRAAARRPRHARARAGRVAVVGRAPAPRPRPGVPRPAPRAGARRGHVEPRPPVGDARSRRRSTRCSRAAPRSSSPTASRPRCGPTASPWSTTAASSSSGSHDELVARGGRYAEMYAAWIAHLGDPAITVRRSTPRLTRMAPRQCQAGRYGPQSCSTSAPSATSCSATAAASTAWISSLVRALLPPRRHRRPRRVLGHATSTSTGSAGAVALRAHAAPRRQPAGRARRRPRPRARPTGWPTTGATPRDPTEEPHHRVPLRRPVRTA